MLLDTILFGKLYKEILKIKTNFKTSHCSELKKYKTQHKSLEICDRTESCFNENL